MDHVNAAAPKGTLDKLKAFRDAAPEGRYSCLACLDTGLLYVARTPYRQPAIGVVPCTECERGGDRHLDAAKCIWARGSKPCSICGAREGEQVPPGWRPEPPAGWIPYAELPGWTPLR